MKGIFIKQVTSRPPHYVVVSGEKVFELPQVGLSSALRLSLGRKQHLPGYLRVCFPGDARPLRLHQVTWLASIADLQRHPTPGPRDWARFPCPLTMNRLEVWVQVIQVIRFICI